jgi:hypothetical protein
VQVQEKVLGIVVTETVAETEADTRADTGADTGIGLQLTAGNMEHGTGSREQGAGSREQGTGNREQGAGSREQGAGSREQGTGNREQGTGKESLWSERGTGRIRASFNLVSVSARASARAEATHKDGSSGIAYTLHVRLGRNTVVCQNVPKIRTLSNLHFEIRT